MKKIITLVLVLVILFAGYVILKNRDLVTVSDPKVDDVVQSEVKIENWSIYTNSEYGLSLSYPAEFIIEERTGYPKYINFDSLLTKLGSSFQLVIYDTKMSPSITSLDTIPRVNRINTETLSTENITNVNGIDLQIIKIIQYLSDSNGKVLKNKSSDNLTIVFMNGSNAYHLEWSCWSNQACFNDEIITKIVDSIKFSK
jgi:hypothetical protein